ncbi:class I SAM-dependent methyltransferase [Pseudokordiimonas caeni]|uniref:class I SAM-dependent methyltransferase n=1 Tax=Pseudokordiimonas caeni TaxID=2997908 RepID=UPI002811E360|nr:class I SAM-dependent methyltransferase [Pseudokordiimonas caeni]
MSAGFKDHFSGSAGTYAEARPDYPDSLFEWLAAQCCAHDLVWDCATGNGQAAVALARHFAQVVATDASAKQIEAAKQAPNISYRVAPAEASGLGAASCDLVTVAQALHWFDLDAFYAEVRRVLKPGGVLAVWTYAPLHAPEDPAVDEAFRHFQDVTLGPWWPMEHDHCRNGYADLEFPFERMITPKLVIERHWGIRELAAYAASWSSTAAFRKSEGRDPIPDLVAALEAAWGEPEKRCRILWDITIHATRL